MSHGAALLSARDLRWASRGRHILGPIDLTVLGGECLAVVGPNGAGKSTLLRLLTGILTPTSGRVVLGERNLASFGRREIARHIAYVPQIRPMRVPLTVEEVVLLGRYPHLSVLQLAPRREDFAAADDALDLVGIGGLRHRPVDELSGGERQAVFVAAALAQQTELLVLDEPSIHLDARHQSDLAALLVRLKRDSGRTVVLATHDLNLASLLGDRLLALAGGVVLAVGRPQEIVEPELLARLFSARFELVHGGARPVTVLELGR